MYQGRRNNRDEIFSHLFFFTFLCVFSPLLSSPLLPFIYIQVKLKSRREEIPTIFPLKDDSSNFHEFTYRA